MMAAGCAVLNATLTDDPLLRIAREIVSITERSAYDYDQYTGEVNPRCKTTDEKIDEVLAYLESPCEDAAEGAT